MRGSGPPDLDDILLRRNDRDLNDESMILYYDSLSKQLNIQRQDGVQTGMVGGNLQTTGVSQSVI